MEFWPFIWSFLGVYLIGGRKIAVPYGIAVLNNLSLVIWITFTFDLLQIPLYYFIFSIITEKIKPIKKFRKRQEKKVERYRAWKLAREYGKIGVFILAALPSFGGGIWTAALLSFILKLNKKVSFLLIALGSLIGITILALASQGIIHLFS